MIQVKDSSIRFHDIVPEMVIALIVADQVLTERGVPCVVTSANDGGHSAASLHYSRQGKHSDLKCRALDIRSKYPVLDGTEKDVRDEIKRRLGLHYDVLIEAVGTDNEHFHIEWDPK